MAEARRAALRARLAEHDLDALLVTSAVNLRWLTGFTGSAGALLVSADGRGDLLAVDGRYAERTAAEAPDVERLQTRDLDWLRARLGERRRLGAESHVLSWERAIALTAALAGREVVPAPGHVEALRAVKDAGELALLERACAATDRAFAALTRWLSPGATERAVARRLEAELLDAGADGVAFPVIVASGPNAARPHHTPGDRALVRGDLVVLDFGAAADGYRADMTRTVAIGPPPAEALRLHAVVLEALAAGTAALRPGRTAGDVHDACSDVVAAAGLADGWLHPPGHALGLEVHEDPVFRDGSAATLLPGMTVALEPGVYVPGLGGVRVEDTFLVGPTATRALTRAPRGLAIL